MTIRRKEFAKVIRQPVLWGLMLIFLVINSLLLWLKLDGGELKLELQKIHSMIAETGTDLSKNDNELQKLYQSKDELDAFYVSTVEQAKDLYTNLDMEEIKKTKEELHSYHPTGSFATFIDRNYEKLQQRMETIKITGEDDYAFYSGCYYQIHSLLYDDLLQMIIIEMMVLMMLSVLFLMDYERVQKTSEVVLVSKAGRTVMMRKAQTGIVAGFLFGSLLLIISLGIFFWQVSFDGLWDVPVSSGMLAEVRGILYYPFITFEKMSVREYLIDSIIIAILLVLFSGLSAATLQFFMKNSYLVFLSEVMLFLGLYVFTFCKTVTWFDVLIDLNPICTWYMCGTWFMENSIWMSFEGTEWISMAVTGIVVGFIFCVGWKRYRCKDFCSL